MSNKPVIVYVQGGVVSDVAAPAGVIVEVRDLDIEGTIGEVFEDSATGEKYTRDVYGTAEIPAENPDEELHACPICSSHRVQAPRWVGLNTDELFEDTEDDCWCEACEKHFRFKEMENIPRKETREWKEEHAEQTEV